MAYKQPCIEARQVYCIICSDHVITLWCKCTCLLAMNCDVLYFTADWKKAAAALAGDPAVAFMLEAEESMNKKFEEEERKREFKCVL